MKKNILFNFILMILFTCCCGKTVPDQFQYLNFKGTTSQHKELIVSKPSIIFNNITDTESFSTLYPSDFIEVRKVTPGPYKVGTVLHTRTKYFVELNWNSRVIEIKPNEKIVLQFTNGLFKGGYEIWEVLENEMHTEVSHAMLYNIRGFFNKLVWIFKKGEKKHDSLVKNTLAELKKKVEGIESDVLIENTLVKLNE